MSSDQWKAESLRWRGRVLTGIYGHWCPDWDDLPIDETCPEWPCPCAKDPEFMAQAEKAHAEGR